MKENTKIIALFMFLSIIFFLSSSFIPHEKEDSLKFSNIEILSQGEESPYPECVMEDGVCIKDDIEYVGMAVAEKK